MRCVRSSVRRALPAVAFLMLSAVPLSAQEEATGLTARIETWGRYYRAGEPVLVRIVVENTTQEAISNPEGLPILANLELSQGEAAGNKPPSVPALDPSTQPKIFAPGAGHLMVTDVAKLFPDLAKPGFYNLQLNAANMTSDPIELMVAQPYDADADYSATLKTDHGDLTFDLLESAAPDHVRNFVDLAKQGYYDGSLFHVIARGEFIMGGSQPADDARTIPYVLPPEITDVKHGRGTLSSVRTSPNGPDNAVQFIIDLGRKAEFDGSLSIFGKITAGEETLKALEDVATSLKNFQPFFKPLQNVVLREVIITVQPREEASGKPGKEAAGGAR